MNTIRNQKGFTLIEILVVIGIIAILAAVVIIAINPARQFAQARDTQRWSNVNTILNAVGQRMADHRGVWTTDAITCTATLPPTPTNIGSGVGLINLEPCIVPTYVSTMVMDPSGLQDGVDTGYSIVQDSSGRVTVAATPDTSGIGDPISVSR